MATGLIRVVGKVAQKVGKKKLSGVSKPKAPAYKSSRTLEIPGKQMIGRDVNLLGGRMGKSGTAVKNVAKRTKKTKIRNLQASKYGKPSGYAAKAGKQKSKGRVVFNDLLTQRQQIRKINTTSTSHLKVK